MSLHYNEKKKEKKEKVSIQFGDYLSECENEVDSDSWISGSNFVENSFLFSEVLLVTWMTRSNAAGGTKSPDTNLGKGSLVPC